MQQQRAHVTSQTLTKKVFDSIMKTAEGRDLSLGK